MIQKHNYFIDLLRFIFASLVVIHHTNLVGGSGEFIFRGGYIFVEFFYFISGYFIINHIDRERSQIPQGHEGHYSIHFTWNKFKAFFPSVILIVLIDYIYCGIKEADSISNFFNSLIYMPYEMLLLPMTGIYRTLSNGPLWFLSSMMIALPIIVYLLSKFPDFTENIIAYVIPSMVYGYFCRSTGDMTNGITWYNVVYAGTLRAFAGIFTGIIIYRTSKWLAQKALTTLSKILLTFFTILFILLCIYLSCFKAGQHDFIIMGLLFLSLSFIFSGQLFDSLLNLKIFRVLGVISFPLFICHVPVAHILQNYLPLTLSDNKRAFALLICSIIFAVIFDNIIKLLKRIPWKKLFLKQ